MPAGVSEIKHLRTGYGFPTAPQDLQAFALTPDTVLLYWKLPQTLNAPANEIKYKVGGKLDEFLQMFIRFQIKQSNQNLLQPVSIGAKQFMNGNFSQDFSDIVGCLLNPCQAKIPNLRPSSDYQFWVCLTKFFIIYSFADNRCSHSTNEPSIAGGQWRYFNRNQVSNQRCARNAKV
jgi:hypothetical protein